MNSEETNTVEVEMQNRTFLDQQKDNLSRVKKKKDIASINETIKTLEQKNKKTQCKTYYCALKKIIP